MKMMCRLAVWVSCLALHAMPGFVSAASAQGTLAPPRTWQEDARDAARAYADEKAKETIKEQSRAAITALYKKVYKSGANQRLLRTLGEVALSAEEINTLADNAAHAMTSGDPEAVKAASGQVAIALGRTLAKGLADPELRKQMIGALGNVDQVNEFAEAMGSAAGGDRQAAYEYLGRALIAVTPAAGVIAAAEAVKGAMTYAMASSSMAISRTCTATMPGVTGRHAPPFATVSRQEGSTPISSAPGAGSLLTAARQTSHWRRPNRAMRSASG
ncbi:MAG: hypothetical protein B7Z40_11405 [Bosea sp. 12-68-7]|nr:MAG: hypothetical protein B7Z40_11405 [Bosea sp. 12-68-7]OYX14814.1 MAG: hypothetical protein B7Z15_02660 [Rhizobiales bacterium 32-66-8]